jgi:hypothetical protein
MIAVRLILLATFLQPTPAHACRLHRTWRFPWPQWCSIMHRPSVAETARRRPDHPAAQAANQGDESRPPTEISGNAREAPDHTDKAGARPISDDEAHAIGIEALKVLIDQMKPQ